MLGIGAETVEIKSEMKRGGLPFRAVYDIIVEVIAVGETANSG